MDTEITAKNIEALKPLEASIYLNWLTDCLILSAYNDNCPGNTNWDVNDLTSEFFLLYKDGFTPEEAVIYVFNEKH